MKVSTREITDLTLQRVRKREHFKVKSFQILETGMNSKHFKS